MNSQSMKLAHLSDIHFFKYDLRLDNFFSKNLLATLNYLANRGRHKVGFDIDQIPNLLKDNGVTNVVITGDFTTTSNLKEYELAKNFVNKLESLGLKTLVIPGNHDTYTKAAALSKRFYHALPSDERLRDESIVYDDFGAGFKYIALDTTIATPLWSSQGLFSKMLEGKLTKLLESISSTQPLILINHFPIVTRKHMAIRNQMVHFQNLNTLISRFSNIKLYLCGHTHLSEIIDQKPIILNSGSLTLTKGGSFHIMDLEPSSVEVEVYSHESKKWEMSAKKKLSL